MGFKRTNYEVKEYGIVLPSAYAQIDSINVRLDGTAHCIFEIQKDRESIGKNSSFETKMFTCKINKDNPLHQQVYVAAKEELFKDWEDDIVETV